MTELAPVRVALIGSGRMGAFHGETIARRLLADAYTAELAAFVRAVRDGTPALVTGEDARAALAIALAAVESVRAGRPVAVAARAELVGAGQVAP